MVLSGLRAKSSTGFYALQFCDILMTKPSQVRVGDQRRVVNILLGCKVSVVEVLSFYLMNCVRRNDIPVISPALTDGSLGDMLFFHSFKNPGNPSINVL